MSAYNQRNLSTKNNGGLLSGIGQHVRLIARLLADSRVSPFLKLLPLASLVYILFPDFPGPIDDAVVVWLGTTLFVELCPPAVVKEHQEAMRSGSVNPSWTEPDTDAVDVEAREEDTASPGQNYQ